MNRTVLGIGIIFLLIGVSVVSSTDNIIKDSHTKYRSIESIGISKELLSDGKIVYGSKTLSPYNLVKFPLDDPDHIETIANGDNTYFLCGGTWSYEYGWFAVEYNSGHLWLIDPETGDMENIGGGGFSGDIAWDDWTLGLYSAGMRGLAFNSEGICYGIDGIGSDYSLYIVDFDPYEETLIGPLINFTTVWVYNLNAEFDKVTDILYILTSKGLYTCDTETCECTFIGSTGGSEISAFAIPYEYDFSPPSTTHSLDPSEPDGLNGWYVSDVNVTLNATDYVSGVKEIKYWVGGGPIQTIDGDNGTFAITQDDDGNYVHVEYWAIDNAGNEEIPHNIFWIDMDQTEPVTDLIYEVIGGNPWQGWDFLFMFTVIDEISGWNYTYYRIDGGEWILYIGGPFILSGDEFFIEYYSVDFAGNVGWGDANITDFIDVLSSDNMLLQRILERFPLLQKLLLLIK